MEDVFNKITKLVSNEVGVRESKLTRTTRLYEDLKIDGDDAFELLKSFEQEFQVDMKNFDFNSYFAPEGIDLLGVLGNLFKKKTSSKDSLNLGDLEKAALRKYW